MPHVTEETEIIAISPEDTGENPAATGDSFL